MTFTEIREALSQLGVEPRQSLGQNFLCDENLARWIVDQAAIQPGMHVVEIGPGLGALTEYIAPQATHLTLMEKDGHMVRWLSEHYNIPSVELFHGDALEFDMRKLHGYGPVHIVGNLPYYISTPLIAKFASAFSPASLLVLTLQHEVSQRMAGSPRTKAYGAMTVCVSRHWNVKIVRSLPPSVFYPQPKITSSVIIMTRKPASEVPQCDDAAFESLVRRGFSERRKQLKNNVPEFRDRSAEIAEALGIPETVRAEELSLDQWVKMTQMLHPATAQKDEEIFNVVDENDTVISSQNRGTVHVNNLRHRAVHMLIFNPAGELFLQKRSRWKDKNPGLWDSSAAGHVDAGETYEQAAARELQEELKVSCPLEKIGKLPCSERTGHEFIEIFRGVHDGRCKWPSLEVETGAFFPVAQVRDWLKRRPTDFSPVFRMVAEHVPELS